MQERYIRLYIFKKGKLGEKCLAKVPHRPNENPRFAIACKIQNILIKT